MMLIVNEAFQNYSYKIFNCKVFKTNTKYRFQDFNTPGEPRKLPGFLLL